MNGQNLTDPQARLECVFRQQISPADVVLRPILVGNTAWREATRLVAPLLFAVSLASMVFTCSFFVWVCATPRFVHGATQEEGGPFIVD